MPNRRSGALSICLLGLASCMVPIEQKAPLTPVGLRLTAIDVSPSHACGVTPDGGAFCWGDNSNGQLGNGSTENVSGVVAVAGGLRFTSISTSFTRTCALTTRGEGYCWGSNPTGGPTRGLKALEESSRGSPVHVADGLELAQIGVGQWHACGLTTDRTAYCWGRDGTLGNGSDTSSAVAVPVAGGHAFAMLSVGHDHTCALTLAGDAYCWGDGSDGQLGHGRRERSAAPVPVAGALRFRSISAGERHTCGVSTQGAAYCWGWNFDTQLGVTTTEQCSGYPCSTTPLSVSDRFRFTTISAGSERTCALTGAGEAVCWGDSRPVPKRRAETASSALPSLVFPGRTFSTLSVSSGKACGLETYGAASCWKTSAAPSTQSYRREYPRFVKYAIIGAILGGLWGFAGARTVPDRYGPSAIFFGARTGALIGFIIGAGVGLKEFMDGLPW